VDLGRVDGELVVQVAAKVLEEDERNVPLPVSRYA